MKTGVLAEIEHQLKRIRTDNKNAPRMIDLDIALFNDEIVEDGKLRIPDPDIIKYAHVALPLADLAPDEVHPVTRERLGAIAARFDGEPGIQVREELTFKS